MEQKAPAAKADWKTTAMPEKHTQFLIEREISEKQMNALKWGNIPQAMEDKWFWYFENGKLYAHRSWTGFCVYILSFIPGTNFIEVTANRDPEQYLCTDDMQDAEILNHLLDWWTQDQYDYYNEWLSETVNNLKRQQNEANRAVPDKSQIVIEMGDITRSDCACIVNAANRTLLGGGGVDGAIHRAAGPKLLEECRTLRGCNTGEAKITKGYNLKAAWVIHTVGPVYSGSPTDKVNLAACYRNSLNLAKEHNIHSIAFPSISTGAYGYPLSEAVPIALSTIAEWLEANKDYPMKVVMVCFGGAAYGLYRRIYESYPK